jgi:mono/diheme cytochrome c family protein
MAKLVRRLVRVISAVLGAVALLILAFVGYVQLTWKRPVDRPVIAMNAPRDAVHVRRGQYLYERSLLCWGCHGSQGSRSSSEPQAGRREFDMTRIGPGFGYVYGSNLTPDLATGLGTWSDGEVVRAIREGLSRDGRLIFPVMAYQFYHGLSDDDALALVAYLRSLQPVRNQVPARRLSFVAKALVAISFIKAESPITRPVAAPPAAPTIEYGKYLSWRASGCAECHTPRDLKTAHVDVNRPLAGGLFPFPEEGFIATGANLTPDVGTGIGGWTEEQFVTAMRTGARPDGTVMLPFMPWPSYASWSRDDLHAVWLYLRSLKPISHYVPASKLTGVAATASGRPRGQAIYGVYCLTCHGDRGVGSPFTTVPLRDAVRSLDDGVLNSFIAEGQPGGAMPGSWKTLTRDQIADVTAFIRSW